MSERRRASSRAFRIRLKRSSKGVNKQEAKVSHSAGLRLVVVECGGVVEE